MTVSFKDKMLPTQPVLSELFKGSESELVSSIYAAVSSFAGLALPTDEFRIEQIGRAHV